MNIPASSHIFSVTIYTRAKVNPAVPTNGFRLLFGIASVAEYESTQSSVATTFTAYSKTFTPPKDFLGNLNNFYIGIKQLSSGGGQMNMSFSELYAVIEYHSNNG